MRAVKVQGKGNQNDTAFSVGPASVESYDSLVIQVWRPDLKEVADVDEQEPRALRPQQASLKHRAFNRTHMLRP